MGDYLVSAAIDFGTTYSGYVYSFKDNNMEVFSPQKWVSMTSNLVSLKTPTTILLDKDKKFHSFGFEAEDKYIELVEEEEDKDWYYFSRFKMLLHNNINLNCETMLEDISNKKLPALKIFSLSIGYLKDHLLGNLAVSGYTKINQGDILFVLTVPAIWDDKAKQFMREAAIEAGIQDEQLKIALEPEAASLWCQHVPIEELYDSKDSQVGIGRPNTKYMVVDLGGGTADITVHQKKPDGALKELRCPDGGPWGGTIVDKCFLNTISQIVGADAFNAFIEEHVGAKVELMREFEVSKRAINPAKCDVNFTVRIPSLLNNAIARHGGRDLKTAVANSPYNKTVKAVADKLRIDHAVAKAFFDEPIKKLLDHMNTMFQDEKMSSVRTILLVGGFSENKIVQEAVIGAFGDKRVIVPKESGLVVLKGATLFGHKPRSIMSRVSKFTYGTAVSRPIEGTFHKFVEVGKEVPFGFTTEKDTFVPVTADQTEMDFDVYSSKAKDPKLITDEGCHLVGKMSVPLADGASVKDKLVNSTLIFGGTELELKVLQVTTGKVFRQHFAFLKLKT